MQITEGSDLLLLSDISTLRMQVSNALPVAVTVYLTVTPLRPLLQVEDSSSRSTIEPDSTSTATVPVESIANGDVTVRAELHAANGSTLGDVAVREGHRAGRVGDRRHRSSPAPSSCWSSAAGWCAPS